LTAPWRAGNDLTMARAISGGERESGGKAGVCLIFGFFLLENKSNFMNNRAC
jgi:hypothetical protein